MAKFPEYTTIGMQNTVKATLEFKTLTSQHGYYGVEQRKQKRIFPRRNIQITYGNITKAQMETLWQFYIARAGSYEAFDFFMPEPLASYNSYVQEYVGIGDGSTDTFNLPCKTSSARTVYADSVALSEGVEYAFTALGGANGADQIDFTDSGLSPPADGTVLTISFTGILKVTCRFMDDNLDYESFIDKFANTGIILKGLLNE